MRYIRILLLNFEHVFEYRSRTFVWFLISLVNPLVLLLFWRGALASNQGSIMGWQLSSLATYYFLLVIARAFLMSHVEDDVSRDDIQQGGLSAYLVKPTSYFIFKFFSELPYRILQGAYGVVAIVVFFVFFGKFIQLASSWEMVILAIFISILAYFLSFLFKMIIGFLAFWFVDIWGFYMMVEVILVIFAGYTMPFELMPHELANIASVLPFSYMIYYPVLSFQGKLSTLESLRVVGVQIFWLGLLVIIYKQLWKRGLKKFTAVGQ